MAHNYNANYNQRPQQPGGLGAYLLGMAPMPPVRQQDLAVALVNRMIDGLDGQEPLLPAEALDPGMLSSFLSHSTPYL